MNKKPLLLRILSLALVAVLGLGLCACPAGEPTVTTGGATSGSQSTTATRPGTGHPDDVTDAVYQNGAAVAGAGAALAEDSFALTAHTPDEAHALPIASTAALFRAGSLTAGATYRLTATEPAALGASNREYDGQGAYLLAPNGILIDGISGFTLKNMIIVGTVTLRNASGIRFENVEISAGAATAVTLESSAEDVLFLGCRLLADGTAILTSAKDLALADSYVLAKNGVADTGEKGLSVTGSLLDCTERAIASTSSAAYIRKNTVNGAQDGVGISLSDGAQNCLIAQNEIKGAQCSVEVKGTLNTAILLNSAITLVCEENTSLYIVENSLGGRIRAQKNNYILADANLAPDDGLDHTTLSYNNENANGDALTDLTARPDAGVNPDLLPHTNKDLFLEMERMESVREGATDTGLAANSYIMELAKTEKTVILAPGVYSIHDRIDLRNGAGQSGLCLYAYGAQIERAADAASASGGAFGNVFNIIDMQGCTVKGLTIGYELPSVGQVYVLEKLGNNKLLVVPGAGMLQEFGTTDTAVYNTVYMGAQRAGDFYPYCDTSFAAITKRADGLMEMSIGESLYRRVQNGDVFTCENKGSPTLYTTNSTDVVFRDVTIYGAAGVFGSMESFNRTATHYYRMHNTTKNGAVIDEATYDRYRALEEEYGVNLEVSVDEKGRYRGSLPRIGSDDATHTTACAQGAVAEFCIFENMSDDATNQNHTHARVDEIFDNGDGTATIVYKGNYSQVTYDGMGTGKGGYCREFLAGDRVFIYTASGQLVCDTAALTPTEPYKELSGGSYSQKKVVNEQMYEHAKIKGATRSECTTYFYCVTVKTADINFDAVAGLDMTDNNWQSTNKVLIDNMSMASNGFLFDNCLIQNIRSRGFLVKSSGGKITNCSFNNIGMSCAAVIYEIYWGESGVSENLVIEKNTMTNTGFFDDRDIYSPIAVAGLGSRVEEDYLPYKNIVIRGNIMRDRTTEFAVYINSACDVYIENNDFGYYTDGDSEERFSRAIHINSAMNIKIAGNTYSPLGLTMDKNIRAESYKNIYGEDVTRDNTPIFPDGE